MSRVGIVTDTINCLPPEVIEEYDIRIVPILLTVDGKTYRDQVEITSDEFWKIFPGPTLYPSPAPKVTSASSGFR